MCTAAACVHRAVVAGLQRRAYAAASAERPDYGATLHLPRTRFQRTAAADAERAYYEPVRQMADVYLPQRTAAGGRPPFVLLDGPPFANGPPHIGHVLNKLLKDMIVRYKMLRGHRVRMLPGWDVHGLPIEIKALQQGERAATASPCIASAVQVRSLARRFAERYVRLQSAEFQAWGVLGDWHAPYTTMDAAYEADQLLVLARLVRRGLVYRALKPVHWSPSSHTALAEAELEYRERESASLYVAYALQPADPPPSLPLPPVLHLLVWTTTPWTLPANRAVAVHRDARYVCIQVGPAGYLVARAQCAAVQAVCFAGRGTVLPVEVSGAWLVGRHYCDAAFGDGHVKPVLHAAFVDAAAGTGLVHMAPSHGMDDFIVCHQEHQLSRGPCLVDADGLYTAAAPPLLRGLSVLAADTAATVARLLDAAGHMCVSTLTRHSWPHDWRTQQPVIVRETRQWFLHLAPVRPALGAYLDRLDVSAAGRERLERMICHRAEWCISRQRVWGVPIPAFFRAGEDGSEDEVLMSEESIARVAARIRTDGADVWWTASAEELLGRSGYTKGTDTLDVWFDSGTAWSLFCADVLRAGGDLPRASPIDMIVEGADQYRGWFQSLLLTFLMAADDPHAVPPVRRLLSHGFVLDEAGRKMSKSLGNVVSPAALFHGAGTGSAWRGHGLDTARLWVGSVETAADVRASPATLARCQETKEKLRNTARFMLANTADFDAARSSVPYVALRPLEKYLFALLHVWLRAVTADYETCNITGVLAHCTALATAHLSAFYFDVVKDTLYTDALDAPARRSVQTALHAALPLLCQCLAPLVPFTADDIFAHHRARSPVAALPLAPARGDSIFDQPWRTPEPSWQDDVLVRDWQALRDLRAAVNKVLQQAREDAVIHRSPEMDLHIECLGPPEGPLRRLLHQNTADLAAIFLLSKVTLADSPDPALARVYSARFSTASKRHRAAEDVEESFCFTLTRSTLAKCPRCWNHTAEDAGRLCARCARIVS